MPDIGKEMFYLAKLREAIPELPADDPIKQEPPDFVFERNGSPLGIELTVFHLPAEAGAQPHQEVHSLKRQVVAMAQEIHADAGGSALYVSAYFSPNRRLSKTDVAPLAKRLAQAILDHPVPASISEPEVELGHAQLPAGFAHVDVHGSVDGIDRHWQSDHGGWVAPITAAHIQSEINRKRKMVDAARRVCKELWLVIVNDMFSGAAAAQLESEAGDHQYDGSFDTVLWLEPHIPKVVHLPLRRIAQQPKADAPMQYQET
jgi:hypothetical protein